MCVEGEVQDKRERERELDWILISRSVIGSDFLRVEVPASSVS